MTRQTADPKQLEEDVLIQRAVAQDSDAFGELVARYEKSLYNVVFGVVGDAEVARDVTQETFLRAYGFLGRYRKGFRFSTWLFRIGVNLGISKLRRGRLEGDVFSERGLAHYGLHVREHVARPDEKLMREENATRIAKAIRELSERYQTVLLMRYKDGLSCRQIGADLGISANSVSIVLHRAKFKLREILGVDDEDDDVIDEMTT